MLLTGCGDALLPGGGTVDEAELVALPQQPGTPAPSSRTFLVRNNTVTLQTLRHPDAFNTPYLDIRFPAGSLSSLNGTPLSVNDSVMVTVSPLPGGYGFTLSPSGLEFTLSNTPSVTLSFARYGDATVADGEPTFADRSAYIGALEIWEEVTIARWRIARASSPSGVSEVSSAVDAPGEFVLAARR